MSLNWSIEDVKDWEEIKICHNPEGSNDDLTREQLVESIITQAIVFRTMAVGIGHITEENADEFYVRSKMWERLNGSTVRLAGEDYSITLKDILRRVGLRTNASRFTDAQFDKNRSREMRQIAESYLSGQKREMREEAAA